MRDTISVSRIALLHPRIRQEVLGIITNVESKMLPTMKIRIVQGLRTFKEQQDLFAIGRTLPGRRVTNARAGASFHNYGLALDFCLIYNNTAISWDTKYDMDKDGVSDWQEVVRAFKAKGYTWGGDFQSIPDNPHLQKVFGYSWQQLLRKYEAKDFIKGYVRL